MAYLGNDLQVAYPTYKNIDDISGSFNSSATSFPLLVNGVAPVPLPLNSQQCLISVGGVVQRPDDSGSEGFRLSGGNIIFASAPTTGADFFGVILAGADYVNVGANYPSGSAAVPSITFDSDLDTGIYNSAANEISFSTGGTQRLSISSAGQLSNNLGSAAAPSYTFSGDVNTGIYSPGADQLAISTNGTKRIEIQADGDIDIDNGGVFYDATNNRLAIGTTSPSYKLDVTGGGIGINAANGSASTLVFNQTGIGAFEVGLPASQNALTFNQFVTSAFQERARIDSSGRLLVGTSTSAVSYSDWRLQISGQAALGSYLGATTSAYNFNFIKSRSSSVGTYTIVASGDKIGGISFNGDDGTDYETPAASIEAFVDGTPGVNDMPGRLVFSTTGDGGSSPTERMRISQTGQVNISHGSVGSDVVVANHTSGSFANAILSLGTTRAAGTACLFIYAAANGANTFNVYNNGNVTNTNNSYAGISDIKLKENIVDASSQWDDIKALQVRNYNFKEGQTHTQIGLVAQEVELISPGLVSESPDRDADGNDLGTTTKAVQYSVLYMKAVKALQEAMERIEQLESEMAAVKTQLP